ncbi:hypothetical protein [Paenibacillus bouchesdurhonensis]|uniref:hypothetical protein n=1 Tax=Paenibacillus bouchesdurhonensis TaxID=1870990 RepID=UPI000DA62617|nr:hypothetical protein [Paenibacillus bouchesdurhonensis]
MSRYPWRDTSEDIADQSTSQWETPGGAQEKADKALQEAKQYSDEKLNAHIGTGGGAHALAVPNGAAGFISGQDQAKLDGISNGAEPNQNAFSRINNIPAGQKEDQVTFTAGVGITVTPDPVNKEIRITSTGTATPGLHGVEHVGDGADPIPEATETVSGLMGAADKVALAAVVEDVEDLAGAGRTTETVKGNADAITDVTAQLADYAKKKYIRVATSVFTVVPGDGTETKINFNTAPIVTDPIYALSNGDLTVEEAGVYVITATITFEPSAVGLRKIAIRINDATHQQIAAVQVGASSEYNTVVSVTGNVLLNAGDFISIYAAQTSTSSLNVADGSFGLHVHKARG